MNRRVTTTLDINSTDVKTLRLFFTLLLIVIWYFIQLMQRQEVIMWFNGGYKFQFLSNPKPSVPLIP
jgi:Zn-dependent protease with chaperone function